MFAKDPSSTTVNWLGKRMIARCWKDLARPCQCTVPLFGDRRWQYKTTTTSRELAFAMAAPERKPLCTDWSMAGIGLETVPRGDVTEESESPDEAAAKP